MLTPEKLTILQTRSTAVSSIVLIPILQVLAISIAFFEKKIITALTITNSHRQISQANGSLMTGVTLRIYHISSNWKQAEILVEMRRLPPVNTLFKRVIASEMVFALKNTQATVI